MPSQTWQSSAARPQVDALQLSGVDRASELGIPGIDQPRQVGAVELRAAKAVQLNRVGSRKLCEALSVLFDHGHHFCITCRQQACHLRRSSRLDRCAIGAFGGRAVHVVGKPRCGRVPLVRAARRIRSPAGLAAMGVSLVCGLDGMAARARYAHRTREPPRRPRSGDLAADRGTDAARAPVVFQGTRHHPHHRTCQRSQPGRNRPRRDNSPRRTSRRWLPTCPAARQRRQRRGPVGKAVFARAPRRRRPHHHDHDQDNPSRGHRDGSHLRSRSPDTASGHRTRR